MSEKCLILYSEQAISSSVKVLEWQNTNTTMPPPPAPSKKQRTLVLKKQIKTMSSRMESNDNNYYLTPQYQIKSSVEKVLQKSAASNIITDISFFILFLFYYLILPLRLLTAGTALSRYAGGSLLSAAITKNISSIDRKGDTRSRPQHVACLDDALPH